MRIAWTGPVGDVENGNAAAMGGLLLNALLERGIEVDVYLPGEPNELPDRYHRHPQITVVTRPMRWEWDRWYSRNRVTTFLSSSAARSAAHIRLGFALLANHRRRPYDSIFQFAQTELFALGWLKRRLPPIVVHPCTSAAQELHWHRRERDYALQSEGRFFHYAMRSFLMFRARVQRRELSKPDLIVGPSDVFNRLMVADYGVPAGITRTLRHPVDASRYSLTDRTRNGRPITLLFASRLSSRKGLELVVGLSHRLADLEGRVMIYVVGGRTMWSDYSRHVRSLSPATARYGGSLQSSKMPGLYAHSDVVLVPSHFEPGSLVVGEALASGVPVVASDEVGPIEVLDPTVCRTFRSGDLDGFERQVRELVQELERGNAPQIANRAREEAIMKFSPSALGKHLHGILEEASHLNSAAGRP